MMFAPMLKGFKGSQALGRVFDQQALHKVLGIGGQLGPGWALKVQLRKHEG